MRRQRVAQKFSRCPPRGVSAPGSVKFFDKPADSGNVVSRGFCPECGSQIYSRNSGMPGMVFVRASSLDDPAVFKPQMVVYTNRAVAWDHMDPSLPRFADMPAPQDVPEGARGAGAKPQGACARVGAANVTLPAPTADALRFEELKEALMAFGTAPKLKVGSLAASDRPARPFRSLNSWLPHQALFAGAIR